MARTRQTARKNTRAGQADDDEEAVAQQQLTPAELLALSVDQLLAPDFISKQTRGANDSESKQETKATAAIADDDDDISSAITATQSASSLVATVLKESRTEHLTSGFRAHDNVREASAVLARLSRELTAQAVSADSFRALANKRSTLLTTLYQAFGDELKARRGVNLRKKKLDTKTEPLVATAITSSVTVMLCILEDAARTNPTLALTILGYLSAQIQGVKSGAFANGVTAAVPAVSSQAFESIHQFLMRIASDSFTSHEIRSRCIELLLGLSIICSSLPYFLSVLQLLLIPPSRALGMAAVAIAPTGRPLTHLNVLSLLNKLQSSQQVHWEPPSKTIRDSQSVINELSSSKWSAIATDGTHAYIHCAYGLLKVGTGNNDTTPGTVYAELKGFRAKERSCLVCVGDKLYYRSPSIHPHAAIVLSTKYLLEIGIIDENGRGSYPSADLSSIAWNVKPPDDDDKDDKSDEKKETITADALQLRMRDIEMRMQQMENDGLEDDDRAVAMDEEYTRISRAIERLEGGEVVTAEDIAAPAVARGGAGGAAPGDAANDDSKDDEKVGKISVMSGYAPFTSDGRFIYLLRPTPSGDSTTKSEVNVIVLDPEASQKLEQAHSVLLRVPPGRSDTVLQFGDLDDPKGKKRKSSMGKAVAKRKGSSSSGSNGGPSLTLGSPDHLNFEGSITMECWLKIPDDAWAEGYQKGLFYHGDGGQMTYVTVQGGGQITAGVNANIGSAHVGGIPDGVDWNEWNHVAVTYSVDTKIWSIIVNGAEISSSPPNPQGPLKTSASWSIGSSFNNTFCGSMAEVRIWRRALPAKEIESNMKRVIPASSPQLVGYWPLNDGVGMSVQDLSRFQHSGSVSAACKWEDASSRPFDHTIEDGVLGPYKFTNEAIDKAIIYTNGESLALLYPRATAGTVFPGVTTAIFQVFNLDTGLLVQESEHTYAAEALSAVYDSNEHMLYMIQGSAGACVKYRLRPPAPFKAEWRLSRMNDGKQATLDTFPTTRTLQESYPLRIEDDDKRITTSVMAKTPILERPNNDDDSSVAVTTIAVHILARLEQDCASLQHVDLLTIPPSLQYTLGVDLSKPTFTSLLQLTEGLAVDYFKPSLAEYGVHANVRMFAFLTILRLLRINVMHLVGWNVDPKECGFLDDRETTTKKKVGGAAAGGGSAMAPFALLFGAGQASDSKMQHRFVDLLNRLIVEAPTNKQAQQVRELVCEQVCETLSVGMAVFYGLAPDRLRILSDLVQEVISLGKRANPLRMLLLTRYFGSQSKAANVVSIVPALVSLHERKQAIISGETKDVKSLDARDETTSAILEKVSYLVLNEAKSLIAEHFDKRDDYSRSSAVATTAAAASSAFGTSMRDFLARVQVCLLSRMDEHAEQKALTAAATKKQKKENDIILASSPNSKVTSTAPAPVVVNVQEQFTISYSLQLIAMCQDLLDFCMNKINTAFPGASVNPTSNPRLMATVLVVADALKTSVGSLLRPLLSGLWSVPLDVRSASNLLPSLHRLLSTLDALSSLTPDVRVKEAAFVNGKSQRLLTTRTSFVESVHPLPRQGQTEKTLTIPGATELVLEVDPRTFQAAAPGSSLTLFKSAGQKDAIENGTFTSQPTRAIRIAGDSVTIVFTCGYARSGRAWGFKVNAKAILEEASLDLPWLLDLTKSVGVLAGRCAGVVLKGESIDDSEKEMEKVLDSELLSEGLEYDDSINRSEVDDLKWLPTLLSSSSGITSLDALARPPLGRQASYLGVSLADLSSQFAARMREKKVSVEHFPVPDTVRAMVDRTIDVVVGVLIKHNQLVTEVKTFLSSPSSTEPSPSLARVWKTPHKLRQWLLKRFQDRKNKEETKLAEAEKKKKKDAEDDNDHKTSNGDSKSSLKSSSDASSMDTKEDGKEVKMDEGGEVKEVDRTVIYKELCDDIVKRAQFLLQIVPVPSVITSSSSSNGAPKFKRAKSIAKGGDGTTSAAADEDASSKAALAAWQSTRETTQLKYANTDERFALLWKHVLRFFEENAYSLDTLTRALLYRRRRARLRAHGFKLVRQLLTAASLSSVKREVISALIPALSSNERDAMAGVAPDIMYRVRPCGPVLGGQVRGEFERLYRMLLDLLKNPKQSGSHLIQATLHAFSLKYTDEDFDLVMSLGIFPALHTILLTDAETSPSAAIKSVGRASPIVTPSSSPKEKKGDDDRETKEDDESSSSSSSRRSEKSEVVEATAKHLTSAFALLDMLTTVLLNRRTDAMHVSSHDQQPVYDILLSQLTQIAAATKVDTPEGVYHPTLPSSNILKGGSSTSADKLDERMATKAGTVTAFGMQTTTAEMGDLGSIDEKEIISDAFNIRVLNLVDNICRLPEGCAHVATPVALSSLLTVLINGTPRSQVVVMRILRKILCAKDGNAPSLVDVDQCVASIDDSTTVLPAGTLAGTRTIHFFLRHMGQGMTCPAWGALALSPSTMSIPTIRDAITRFRYSRLYSSDGVATWAEEAMLVRYLAQHNDAWKNVISQVTLKYMVTLPDVMTQLTAFDDATKSAALGQSSGLWNNVWLAVGALSVYGGHVDTLRVGTRVHLPSTGTNGTVVSRSATTGTINMVSDGEGNVSVEQVADVSCLGDIAFSLATFNIGLDQQARLLQAMNTIVESVKDQLHDEDEHRDTNIVMAKPKAKKAAAAPVEVKRAAAKRAPAAAAAPAPASLRSGRGSSAASRVAQGPQGPPGTQMFALQPMDVDGGDDDEDFSAVPKASSSSTALEEDDDDIDLGNPDDDDNDRDELQIDDKPDATAAAILMSCIRSRCVRVLNTLLLHPHLVEQFMKHCKNDALFASATQITPYAPLQSTASLEDRLQAITMEMTRRARPFSDVSVTLRHEEPRLKLAAPKLEFDTEYTRIGTKISDSKSLIGSLSYIRLNETPTADVCRGRVVMLDTYGDFEERLNMIAEFQPVAVILALHTDNVKAEGLDEVDDDEDGGGKGGKKKKGKKATKKKKKRSDDDDEETDVIAQSQNMALSMAMASASGGGGFGLAMARPTSSFGQPPRSFGGGFGGGFGGFGSLGGGGFTFEQATPFMGGGGGGMSLGGSEPAPSSSRGSSSSSSSSRALGKIRRSKSDAKVEPVKPSETAKKLSIVAIPTSTAESLRILLGVRDSDSPERLFKKSLSDELIIKGYPKEHTYRALKKNDFDVDKAAEWLDQNKEWLYKPNQIMMEMDDESAPVPSSSSSSASASSTPTRPRGVSAASIADTNLDDIIDADPSALALERTWNRFAKETPTSESLQQFQDSARRADTCDTQWYKDILTKSTWYLLSELRDTERSLFIHYARRSLMSLFIRWPFGTPLSVLGSKQMLRRTLRVGLSLTGHPAAALEPTRYLDHGVYRTEVLSTVMSRSRVGDGDLLAVLVDDCYELLLASLSTRVKKTKPKLRTHQATCASNMQQVMPGVKLEMPGFSSIRIKLEMDQQTAMNGVQMRIRFWSDSSCTQLIKVVNEGGGLPSEGEIIIPRNICWYQVSSPSFYIGSNPMSITFHCRDTTTTITSSDADTMRGGVEAALVEIDLILRSQQKVAPRLALLLLRSLAKCSDSNLAQETCRAAIRLFNHWKGCVADDAKYKSDVRAISRLVDGLEKTHSSLRTGILVNWNSGAAPGPHLQTLLELVLSARSAIPTANAEDAEDEDGFANVPSEAEPWIIDAYKKYRDGRHTCSLINASTSTLLNDLTLSTTGTQQQRRFGQYEFFVADVCVRGGKWYFEVKLLGPPDFLSIGWVTRDYRPSNGNMGADQAGHSWCLQGGTNGSNYVHRSVQRTPVLTGSKSKDGAMGGVAVFAAGTIIGVMLDMENREMQFTFAGKSTGIAFGGFEPDGLFPAILMGYNAQITINFGAEPFVYPMDGKEQFAGLEDPRIKGSSWLARYQHASDCTRYLYDRTPLPSSVIMTALERDVTLTADNDIRFEVTKTDTQVSPGNSPANMLLDTPAYFQSAKTTNLHVTFNVASSDTEVILQEVTVKCYQYIRGVCGLVFMSQNIPDFDSFGWCDGWQKEHYTRFANKKKATEEPYRSHEPVGFFTTPDSFARIKLDQPRRGKYITLKISSLQPQNGLFIERIIFTAIHGSHPLGALLGTSQLEKKQAELREALSRDAVFDKNWTLDHDEQLVLLVQTFCTKLGVSPGSLDAIMFTPTSDQLLRFKFPEDISMGLLRSRFSIIKYLNRLVTPLLHYVDIRLYQSGKTIENKSSATAASSSSSDSKEISKDAFTVDEKSLSYVVHQLKGLFFYSTKKSVFDALLASGSSSSSSQPGSPFSATSMPRVEINRIKASRAKESAKDPDGLKSVFGQLWTQLKAATKWDSLKGKKNQQMWSTSFLGEGSIDVGGPYRECLSNVCADLMSDVVPLFVRSPNRRNDVGMGRDRWVINPGCTQPHHIDMYEFVGVLMGIALRTSFSLNLDLPSFVWKQLLGERVEVSDLEAIDKLFIQAIGELGKLSKDKFEDIAEQKFTTQYSNGKEVELKRDGRTTNVTYELKDEFFKLSIDTRLHEADQQIRAMRKGLNQIVPANYLGLFSWFDLELMVCGNPEVDLEVLRKHTVYNSISATSSLVRFFWQTMESFNTEERQMFLRFVWGRSRLPVSEGDWVQQFTINPLIAGDDKLPIAHTCFFSIDLPNYSSFEIMRKKLHFAIYNCQAIDVDFNPDSSSLNAWVEME